jgi:hypothetical protein
MPLDFNSPRVAIVGQRESGGCNLHPAGTFRDAASPMRPRGMRWSVAPARAARMIAAEATASAIFAPRAMGMFAILSVT